MKKNVGWYPSARIAAGLLSLFIISSCQKEESLDLPAESDLTALVEKVETEYVEGAEKIEGVVEANPVVTRASPEVLATVQKKVDEYYKNLEGRYRVSAEYDGYSVGVVPATDDCGSEERIKYFMDNQDGGVGYPEGWVSSWHHDDNANSWHTICRVDGRLFKFLHLTPSYANGGPYNREANYAVVRLGNDRPTYMIYNDPYVVYHDNEDSNNQNNSTAGQVGSNSYINHGANTSLQFWIGHGSNNMSDISSYMYEFPNLGFNYAVFGTEANYPVISTGRLHIDDENSSNANSITKSGVSVTYIPGYGVDRTHGVWDTQYNFMRVR